MGLAGARGLTIRVGTDLGELARDLAARLAAPHGRPLEPDVVVVPTPGIGSWLESRLASTLGAGPAGDGICANVEFLLVGEVLRRVSAVSEDGDGDGDWTVGAMTLAALGVLLDESEQGALASLLDLDTSPNAYVVARAAADLFDQLFRWRPDVADAWLTARTDDPRAALLRALARRTSELPPHQVLEQSIKRLLRGEDATLELPGRVHLFGGESLGGGPRMPRVLDALGEVRDVCVHLVAPSATWFLQTLRASPQWTTVPPDRATKQRTANGLLDSWGAASSETAMLLAQLPTRLTTSIEGLGSDESAEPTLLSSLHSSIRGEPATRRPADPSVSLHGCVGALRQVEVARDAILHALSADDSLTPSDVVVLCADMPRFAPYVEAVLGDHQGAPLLPYVLRDRAVSSAVPFIAGVEQSLRMLGGRIPRSAVIDLLRNPMVARCFGIGEEDVDRIVAWSLEGDVRWGLDGAHREQAGIPAHFEAGTWRRALDRLLAGMALPSGTTSDALPIRALEAGHDLDRVGALCDVLETIAELHDASLAPRPVAAWCDHMATLADRLFSLDPDDADSAEQLARLLGAINDDARDAEYAIPYDEFRALFSERAEQVRDLVVTGPGGVTVTSFAPLRNVPFRVVVLLGLDEASVERATAPDVAYGEPRIGDRDPRADLRASLLAAVLAARSSLIVTYDAFDVAANEAVTEATVLSELREALDCVLAAGDTRQRHPRHAHGDDDLGSIATTGPFTFDRGALQRAGELRAVTVGDGTRARFPIEPASGSDTVRREELCAFLKAPQRAFLERTHGIRLPTAPSSAGDEIATSLDDLTKWNIVMSLTDCAINEFTGDPEDDAWNAFVDAWAARPDLPIGALPGRLRAQALTAPSGVGPRARELVRHITSVGGADLPELVTLEVRLDGGHTVRGEVDVFAGTTSVRWTASSNDRKARVDSAVDLLLLTVNEPATQWRSFRIWRDGRNANRKMLTVPGDSPDERHERASRGLSLLVELRRRGLTEPLPMFFGTTLSMRTCFKGEEPPSVAQLLAAGSEGFTSTDWRFGDDSDAAVQYCFDASYEELCNQPASPRDPAVDLDVGGSRLLTYSLALLDGLLEIDGATRLEGAR
jgi:exodeoxyribonuclease V gamma subunit